MFCLIYISWFDLGWWWLLIGYLIVMLIMYLIQERFIFKPEKLAQDFTFKYDIPFRELFFDVEPGVRINGLHFHRPDPSGLILYFHGNSRSIKGWARYARDFYRYMDCTTLTEILSSFVEETIEKELPAEILFLQQYDTARKLMREVVDLPNRHADLFVRLCLQNQGAISKSRRQLPEYAVLSNDEIAGLKAAVAEAFALKRIRENRGYMSYWSVSKRMYDALKRMEKRGVIKWFVVGYPNWRFEIVNETTPPPPSEGGG
jgi:hypothetical protein